MSSRFKLRFRLKYFLDMRQSEFFVKTLKEATKGAETINHQLLVRAGYVRQLMAGVYTYLPLGLKTLNKISQIIIVVGKVGFVSLGCPKALVDSELILTQLSAEGYETAKDYSNTGGSGYGFGGYSATY